MPSIRPAIAVGWSPAGAKGWCSLKGESGKVTTVGSGVFTMDNSAMLQTFARMGIRLRRCSTALATASLSIQPLRIHRQIQFITMTSTASASLFGAIDMAPRDPILGITEAFNADTNPAKINLGVGVYYDENGKVPLLQCVQKAEAKLIEQPVAAHLPSDRRPGSVRQGCARAGIWGRQRRNSRETCGHRASHRRHRRPQNRRRFPQALFAAIRKSSSATRAGKTTAPCSKAPVSPSTTTPITTKPPTA